MASIRNYDDIDEASQAVYEAASRSLTLNVGLAYGILVRLLANFCDAWTAKHTFSADSEEAVSGYIFRTFRLLSAMNQAHPDRDMASTHPVRRDIIIFLDDFLSSHR